MKATVKDTINNENGFVLVAALLMVAIVTVIGIAATRTSETEIRISVNEREYVNDFYNTEGALIDTLERSSTWLTGDLLTDPENAAPDDIDTNDVTVRIRCVANDQAKADANKLPKQKHIVPPPPGSGYSMKYFEVHRYGVTVTSATGNSRIQAGAWKAFNKSQ